MPTKGETTKAKIIRTAAALAYRQGFQTTGLQEILDRCAVPKGSFYFHFPSKDALCEAVVKLRQNVILKRVQHIFSGAAPLRDEVARWFDTLTEFAEGEGQFCGCPVGNLAQELSTVNEPLRQEIARFFAAAAEALAVRLREAQEQGEIPAALDPLHLANFLLQLTQGAQLLVKVERSARPLRESRDIMLTLLCGESRKEQTRTKGGCRA
ncbi:MAG: TetR family transcriptional regulator C-terminal domain-containing protein [Thermodesulfobacteriota bacterium]|jgi:TetR/AcrR family transcriptional repressor of nem operon